ncbi:MAG TPA: hypothetical protein PLS72_12755 [Ilumatobacteraceae bacterium]|nr:hypothetical protein [Ilumatobacteraceae bacterium]
MRRTVMVLVVAGALLAGCGDDMGSSGSAATDALDAATAAPTTTTPSTTTPSTTTPSTATPSTTGAPGTGAPQPGDTAQPASEVPEALQFAAPLVGGGSLDFSQYAGTTVALWFWAPT